MLAFSISLYLFAIFSTTGSAYNVKEGILTATNVNVRSGPGTEYGKIAMVTKGQKVTVINEATATTGKLWYQVKFNAGGKDYNGYILAQYISITSTAFEDVPASADPEFEKVLEAQKFPETYRKYLRYLHKYHKNWQFQSVQTGLDWNTVIKNEAVVGRNLVQSSSLDSWKSLEAGAYDWETGKWYGLDSASWVGASKEVISYFMDPRNFLLGDATILQFEALNYVSATQTQSGIADILKGSFMANQNYYNIFLAAAKDSNVSPYHLSSRCLQEVGVNGSKSSSGTVPGYEGLYNFFNIGAVPGGQGAVINGLIKARAMGWTSPELSIRGGAKIIGANYINKGQNTLYFQKFDVTDGGNGLYSHQYMTNLQAPTSEAKNMAKSYSDFNNAAITFYIPVYNNMPEKPCPQPTGDGNPNNLLKTLSVNGYNLTPTFDKYTQEYSLIVPANVGTIGINAAPILSSAKVSGNGNVALKSGNNAIQVVCTAENGSKRVYTINVVRQAAPNNPDNNPVDVQVTTGYRMDNTVSGITPGTSAADFLKNIKTSPAGSSARLVNRDGTINNGVVKTGDVMQVLSGTTVVKQYPLVIYGDIDGNGQINILDLAYVKRQVLDISYLNGVYGRAANIDGSSNGITILDLTYMKRHILGIQSIKQ